MLDTLLGDEEECRAAVEQKFAYAVNRSAGSLPSARSLTDAMHGRLGRDGNVDRLGQVVESVLDRSVDTYRGLLEATARKAVDSIAEELLWCERTLDRKYAGVTEQSMTLVAATLVEPWAEARVDAYQGRFEEWRDTFEAIVWTDWRASITGQESLEQWDARMFSVEQVRLPGHSGRGTWWQPFQWTFAEMRAGEFLMVNDLRRGAMRWWNTTAAERG